MHHQIMRTTTITFAIAALLAGCASLEVPGGSEPKLDASTYTEVRSWPLDASFKAADISADGSLVVLSYKGTRNYKQLHRFNLNDGTADSIEVGFSPEGLGIRPVAEASAIAFANDGMSFLVNWPSYLVRMNAENGQTEAVTSIPTAQHGMTTFNAMAYASDGSGAFGVGPTLVRIDLSDGGMRTTRDMPTEGGRSLGVIDVTRAIIGSSQHLTVATAGAAEPDCQVEGVINDVDVSPDGVRFAAAVYDRETKTVSLHVWSLADCQELQSWPAEVNFLPDITWLPDGRTLAGAGRDGLLRFWDTETGTLTSSLQVEDNAPFRILLSADARRLATVSLFGDSMYLRVFDTQ